MAKCRHQKSKITCVVRPFSGPVGRRENRAAHGNICQTERCSCGAVRHLNINGAHIESSGWGIPEAGA